MGMGTSCDVVRLFIAAGAVAVALVLLAGGAEGHNITALLDKGGCKTFASLVASSGVLKIYQSAMDKGGLTLLAPNDDAFRAPDAPDLSSLSSADLVTLLRYHALPSYTPKSSLKTAQGPLPTLASRKYDLSVVSSGDDVSLVTGVHTSRVASTVLDDTPLCILTVDSLLLPVEIFRPLPLPPPRHRHRHRCWPHCPRTPGTV